MLQHIHDISMGQESRDWIMLNIISLDGIQLPRPEVDVVSCQPVFHKSQTTSIYLAYL